MKVPLPLICLAALLPATALAVNPAHTAPKAAAADGPSAAPTQLDRTGRIVVAVSIDGKGPFRFLVDTGADGSMISPRLVRALGLVPSRTLEERVQGTTGIERLPCVTIDSLRIGSIVKRDVLMPISRSPVLIGLDGILGMAGFGPVRVTVDFHRNRVLIGRSDPHAVQGYLDIHARRTAGGLLMVPARVGNIKVEAVIDTGAAETLGNGALRQALLRNAAAPPKATVYGVTRQLSSGGISAAPTIYLGPAAIRNLRIVYSEIPIFSIWHIDSRPALIIGMNVLGAVDAMVLDYPRARVYLRTAPPTGVSVGINDVLFPTHDVDGGS